jgi:hypothetical protein
MLPAPVSVSASDMTIAMAHYHRIGLFLKRKRR